MQNRLTRRSFLTAAAIGSAAVFAHRGHAQQAGAARVDEAAKIGEVHVEVAVLQQIGDDRTENTGLRQAEEVVAEATGTISKDYRSAVMDVLLKLPASGFERLCQRILREAGFTQVVVTAVMEGLMGTARFP